MAKVADDDADRRQRLGRSESGFVWNGLILSALPSIQDETPHYTRVEDLADRRAGASRLVM